MILGRSLTLWAGAVTAAINALVVVGLLPLTGEQVAAVNAAVLAVLAILAGQDSLTVAKGTAASARLAPTPTDPTPNG